MRLGLVLTGFFSAACAAPVELPAPAPSSLRGALAIDDELAAPGTPDLWFARLAPEADGVAFVAASWDVLYAGRMGFDGVVRQLAAFPRAAATIDGGVIASNGAETLVVWYESRGFRPGKLRVARLDPAQPALHARGSLAVQPGPPGTWFLNGLTLAASTNSFALAWSRWEPSGDGVPLWLSWIQSGAGSPSEPFEVTARSRCNQFCGGNLVWDGQAFVLAWEDLDASGIRAARFRTVEELQAAERVSLGEGFKPRLSSGGEHLALSVISPGFEGAEALIFSRSFEVLAGPVALAPQELPLWSPQIQARNDGYLVVHGNDPAVVPFRAERRDAQLVPIGEPIQLAPSQAAGALGADTADTPGGVLVSFWLIGDDLSPGPFVSLVGDDDVASLPRRVIERANYQLRPWIASDGDASLVWWADDRMDAGGVWSRSVQHDGAEVPARLVEAGTPGGWLYTPVDWRADASHDGRYFVLPAVEVEVEERGCRLREHLADASGAPQGEREWFLQGGGGCTRTSSARSPSGRRVVAIAGDVIGGDAPPQLVVFAADGTIAARRTLSELRGRIPSAAVAAAQDSFWLAWTQWPDRQADGSDLHLARFDFDAQMLPPGILTLSADPREASDPQLVMQGDSVIAVWTEIGPDGEGDVAGAHIAPGAAAPAITPFEIAVGPAQQWWPALATAGADTWVVWSEEEPAGRSRVVAGRVAGAGSPSVADRVFVSPEDEDARSPSAAADSRGRILVAHERFDHTPGVLNWRVVVRPLPDRPQGAACLTREECASHNCTDGVCCNQPCSGGSTDCLACSVAAGAAEDGRCAALPDGAACGETGDRADAGCVPAATCAGGLCVASGDACGGGGAGAGASAARDSSADAGGCGCGAGRGDRFAALGLLGLVAALLASRLRARGSPS